MGQHEPAEASKEVLHKLAFADRRLKEKDKLIKLLQEALDRRTNEVEGKTREKKLGRI